MADTSVENTSKPENGNAIHNDTSINRNHSGRPYLIEPMSNYDFSSNSEKFKFNHDFSGGYLFVKLTDIETKQDYIGCMNSQGEITYAMAFDENSEYYYYGMQDGMLQMRGNYGKRRLSGFHLTKMEILLVLISRIQVSTNDNSIICKIIAGGDRYIAVEEYQLGFTRKFRTCLRYYG